MSEATHETFATSTDRHSVQGREGSDHGHTGIDEENRARSPLQPSMIRSIVLIFTCTAAMVVNISNSTLVSIALPSIGKDLRIPEQKLQWLISAYSLSSGCLLLFFGRLADLYGRKTVFIWGSLGLTAFSLGLGFANDEITLDVLRGLQGVGGAATIPSAIGILAHAFPPSRMRAVAFATFSAGAPIGAAFGMILGGVLTEETKQHWRSTFYLSTGLTAACLILGMFSIDPDEPSTETDRRIDWLGALLVTAGLVLIVFVLSDGEIVGWKTPYIIALLILGVLLLVLFLFWQRYLERIQDDPNAVHSKWTPPPLMRLSIWRRAKGRFAVIMAIAFLNWSGFLAFNFFVQLYYQLYSHLSPIDTMIRLLPMFVTGIVCNFIIAVVIGRISLVWIVVFGTLCTGAASLLFALIDPSAPYWAFGFPAAIICVVGADFVYASGTIFVAKVALPHEQSVGGALFQTMTQIGTSFGVTISTIVFDRIVARDAQRMGFIVHDSDSMAPPPAQLSGYRAAQWTAFSFAALSAVLAAIFLRGVGVVGFTESDKREETEKENAEKPEATV